MEQKRDIQGSRSIKHSLPPASDTTGFFQESPEFHNAFTDDTALQRIFFFYLPKHVRDTIEPDLLKFGSLVLQSDILRWTADAESNPPRLSTWDTWGRRKDDLVTSEGWRNLQKLGIAEGIVAIAYERDQGAYSRLHQFLKYHMWTPASAMVTCPSAMQDGAASLLQGQLASLKLSVVEREVFQKAYNNLTSRDPVRAWTSGQWMTERPGGSDVRNTETQALYSPIFAQHSATADAEGNPLGPWSLSGFKWFSSATDSQMSIMLAKMPDSSLSAFYAPIRRRAVPDSASMTETELNGIRIQRLKSKLGTRALPTAELILSDTRAYMIGEPGQGVKTISAILNITRLHTAMGAVGYWGRGIAIARTFSLVRKAGGHLLADIPSHVRTMAEMQVRYTAMMHMTFFAAALLGVCESTSPVRTPPDSLFSVETAPYLLRLVTPLAKALAAKSAIAGLAECMESLGGVGYLENDDPRFNIARLFRDVNVLSIWEGTTNVMAHDVVRVLKGSAGEAVLESMSALVDGATIRWVQAGGSVENSHATLLRGHWKRARQQIETRDTDELLHDGRVLVEELGWIVCAVLLGEDARSDSNAVMKELWRRYVHSSQCADEPAERDHWKNEAQWDRRIVFGDTQNSNAKL